MRCQFFCSEEHARAFRASTAQPDGEYLTLEQAAFSDRLAQAGLFPVTDL